MMYWNKQGTALVQQSTAAELSNLLQNPLTSGFFLHMQIAASVSPGYSITRALAVPLLLDFDHFDLSSTFFPN